MGKVPATKRSGTGMSADKLPADYTEWLEQLTARIKEAQLTAVAAVNLAQATLYWQIGRSILERQARQGEGLVQFVRAAHEGQRNTRLFWAACRAYEHGFGDDLAPALTEAAVATGLTEQEARAAIASAARLTIQRPSR